ncbi:MAG TPA: PAS domain S-box protein [Blastocatellia bacterium]|nr:PAS domain S-box protein [Blastocatellia bacterium]
MANILIVDDHPTNRDMLVTLLGYKGHILSEACNGVEGLERAHDEHPDLIITDVLMPVMDGFELLKRLRADAATAATPVILSSGHYLEGESRKLTHGFGISMFLNKPSEPEEILRTVDQAIARGAAPETGPNKDFDELHLRAITDKLAEKTNELGLAQLRLAKLVQIGQQMVSEREPLHLLSAYCHASREIIGAKWAMIGVSTGDPLGVRHLCTSGLDDEPGASFGCMPRCLGVIADMIERRASIRLHNPSGDPQAFGFPPDYPVIRSILGSPIVSREVSYGWICLGDAAGDRFSDLDEQLISMLAGHLAVAYEKSALLEAAVQRTAELEKEIAERKRAEEALTRSEERYRLMIETAEEGVWVLDADNKTVLANEKMAQMLGCSQEEMLHRSLFSFMDDEGCRIAEASLKLRRQGIREQLDFKFRRNDGSFLWTILAANPLYDSLGNYSGALAMITDITQRKQAEEMQSYFTSIIESSDDAIFGKALDDTIVSWNAGAERIYGYTTEEATGRNVSMLAPPDREHEAQEINARLKRNERIDHFETVRLTKDGRLIDVSLSVSPIYDQSGRITGASAIARDITERKRAQGEIARARDLALDAERLKSEFVANINHELRTPMNGIIGCAELALETELDAEQREYLSLIRRSADRMMTLVEALLTFSGIDPGKLNEEDFDIEHILGRSVQMLAEQARSKGLGLSYGIDSGVPARLRGDAARLLQILVNLLGNAVKFTTLGEISLTAGLDSLNEDVACLHFVVQDTGIGIPADKIESIFGAFVQVDGSPTRRYEGTGLGLAVCRQMATKMQGYIWAESEEGRGSAFHFTACFGVQAEAGECDS